MPGNTQNNIPGTAPFDAIATGYDAAFSDTAVGRLQRARVWHYLPKPSPGATVLELNCGTGADAIHLARLGYSVLATDAATGMIAIVRKKTAEAGLTGSVETEITDIQSIARNPEKYPARFDLVFSNFGGLNCISPQEIRELGAALPKILKPGGLFIAVVMGRFCWWETLYFLWKGKLKQAFRRLARKPIDAPLDASTTIPTWYYAPSDLKRNLIDHPSFIRYHSIGFFLPPSYLNSFFEQRPRLLHWFKTQDDKLTSPFWAHASDHFLIRIQP